ncbi:hypothetical protein Tco_0695671 [Tanacetum coccineum]
MKEKMVYKGNNVVGGLMNVPIFVGTFSVVTDFVVLENMDEYHDNGMGDVIFGEPFLREVRVKEKRFDGIITIYNGDDEVTYQMVRSHPRFGHHTNEQCNKISPLLKVSEEDKMDEISNYGVHGEVMLKDTHFGAKTKSSRKSTDLTANTPYYSRPIRHIQDFDELKDHCLTLNNTSYPHQRYAVYNTLVNEEEKAGFIQYAVSIKKIRRIRAYTSQETTKT